MSEDRSIGELRKPTQLRWDGTRQIRELEMQHLRVRKVPELMRYRPDRVVAEFEGRQPRSAGLAARIRSVICSLATPRGCPDSVL